MRELSRSRPAYEATNASFEKQEIERLRGQLATLKQEALQESEAHKKTLDELKETAGQLAVARDQALHLARLKTEFLANMSHEIRTPLNGVVGMAKLLLRTTLEPLQRDYANIVHDSANVLLDIVNDILDFSKIESGKLALELVDFDVSATVEATANLLSAHALEKGISLMTFIDPSIPRALRGDEGHIRQVLLNLLSNAVKFTDKGDVVIKVVPQAMAEGTITLHFSVKDTGTGFPQEALNRLFEPFTQADGSITRKFGGTGLGLSICKGLTELMGGEIGAETKPGEGSCFWFTVALAVPDSALELKCPDSNFSGRRILILGACPGAAAVIEAYASAWGLDSDSQALLDDWQKSFIKEKLFTYDAIILDAQAINLPLSNLPDALPSELSACFAKTILMAGTGQGQAELAANAGFAAYLKKPVASNQLQAALRSVICQEKAEHLNATVTQPIPAVSSANTLILVAEDSPTNRKVAGMQLSSLGFTAQAVANGAEAVEAAASGAYALVLMDCQMPEMDGFQATRAIRKAEAHTGIHIPVIAMTAHAMEGDREQCLAAGMDDYLSKPVDIDQLRTVLDHWLSPGQTSTGKKPAPTDDVREIQTIWDEPINLPGLQESCGPELTREIVEVYLSAAETLLEGIEAARLKRDGHAITSLAHQLAGSSRAVGAREMARISSYLEEATVDQSWLAVLNAHDSLRWAFKRLRRFLSSSWRTYA